MTKNDILNYLLAISRIYLALVFLIGGLDKINNLAVFAQSIENYRILPIYTINIFAIIIPWIEVLAGFLLLIGLFIKENSAIIFSMLFIFTTAIIIAIFRNLDIDCGCMGTSDGQKVELFKVVENILLIIFSLLSFKYPYQKLTYIKLSTKIL